MILGLISRDNLKRAARTFLVTFVTLFGSGSLGFLKDVSAWAASNGQRAFPDYHNLSYLAVTALIAALTAAVNIIWVAIEDGLGKGFLRTPVKAPEHLRNDGHVTLALSLYVTALALAVGAYLAVIGVLLR